MARLLQEDGFAILQEDGYYLLLQSEASVGDPTYSVQINGVERDCRLWSLQINEAMNRAAVFTGEFISEDATFRPALDDEIVIRETGDAERVIFGGIIDHAPESSVDGHVAIDAIATRVNAVDFRVYCDWRYVNETFAAGTLKSFLDTIVATYLADYGVTLHGAQADGPDLEGVTITYRRLTDVLNDLSMATMGTEGSPTSPPWLWEIDFDKRLRFFQAGTEDAPVDLIEGDGVEIGDLEITPDTRGSANRVILLSSGGAVTTVAEDLSGSPAPLLRETAVSTGAQLSTEMAALVANGLLQQANVVQKEAKYDTLSLGLRPGQTQTITSAKRNVNSDFLITEIVSRMIAGGQRIRRTITAIEGYRLHGSWMDVLQRMAGGPQPPIVGPSGPFSPGPSGSGGGGGGVTSPAPEDTWVQINKGGVFGAHAGLRWLYDGDPIDTPAVGTVANTGAGAYAATIRYYKIQFLTVVSGLVTQASELGPVFSFTPSGSGTAARVTRPAVPTDADGTPATHWTVWASDTSVDADFVNISTNIAVATTTYDDSVVPGSYSGGSPFESYTNKAQLRIAGFGLPPRESPLAIVSELSGSVKGAIGVNPYDDTYQEMFFGIEWANGQYVCRSEQPAFITAYRDGAFLGGTPEFTCQFYPGQTIGAELDLTIPGAALVITQQVLSLTGTANQAMGAGEPGYSVLVGCNTSGAGAAGSVTLQSLSGANYYLWVDNTGVLRIHTAKPVEGSGDTSGTVVGAQS